MPGPPITLYDLSSTLSPQAWSSNTWKVRIVLNYKRIAYETVWISFPDIKSTLESIGGKPTQPHPDGGLQYTLPAIVDTSSGTPVVVTDSLAITEYLEEKYPDRPVFPKQGKALEYAFEQAFRSVVAPHIAKVVFPNVVNILDDRSKAYFRDTRERWYGGGKRLEELYLEGPVREALWQAAQEAMNKLAQILDMNGPGVDYVAGGSHPTRADIIIVAFLAWIIAVLPEDWDNRVKHWDGGRWEKLWKVTEEWRAVL